VVETVEMVKNQLNHFNQFGTVTPCFDSQGPMGSIREVHHLLGFPGSHSLGSLSWNGWRRLDINDAIKDRSHN